MSGEPAKVTNLNRTNYVKGVATRTAILDIAAGAIAELGLSRASSREIVRRSGYTWGVIQHHFGTYNALLLAVVDHASAGLRSVLAELDAPAEATPVERVQVLTDVIWDYFRREEYLGYLEINLHLLRDPEASDAARTALHAFDADAEAIWHGTIRRIFGDVVADTAYQRLLFATMRGLAVSRWLNEGVPDFVNERMILAHMLANYIETASR